MNWACSQEVPSPQSCAYPDREGTPASRPAGRLNNEARTASLHTATAPVWASKLHGSGFCIAWMLLVLGPRL
jgi:hypothetical protein